MKSRFKVGWLLCMFDLPTVEREEQRLATRFRQGLLEMGFFMLQESVYVRNCVSMERHKKYMADVERIAPDRGLVNLFFITERQWLDSKTPCLQAIKPKSKRKIDAGEEIQQQISFW